MRLNSTNKVVIHRLDKKEADAAIAQELFRVANAGFKGTSPWTLEQIENTLAAQSSLILYASIDQKIVGFIMASEDIQLIDIFIVVVDEAYKKQSIGTQLFEYLIRYGSEKEIEAIVLETRKSNIPAIKLYQRVGFKEVGMRRAYYSSPIEDAIVMKRDLGEETID